MTKYTRLRGSF